MPSMFIVSCRKDFWSATEFSAADEIRRVDLGSGTGTVVPRDEFVNEVAGRPVTILVHGYNNEERDVVDSYATIDARMRLLGFLGEGSSHYDAVIGYAWPGGAVGVSFPFARLRATEAAPRFAHLLASLRGVGVTIDLNTHSLGAHVVLEALGGGSARVIRNAWNFASAVDNESVEFRQRYYAASQRCERFFIFYSKNDPVLRVWYRIGDLFDFDTALGYSGPEDPAAIIKHSLNVRVINCKDVVHSHGGYRSAGQVWAYMARELNGASPEQFTTLSRTPEAVRAVFRASDPGPLAAASPVRPRPKRIARHRAPGRQ